MGVGATDLETLIALRDSNYLPVRGSVIDIGAQQLANLAITGGAIDRFANAFERVAPLPEFLAQETTRTIGVELQSPHAPYIRDLWKSVGWEYAAIDVDGSPGSIEIDMNFDDAPRDMHSKFDLVTNFGTTEHIANQANAFRVIHDLTKIGGVMTHYLPSQGMHNHGLFNYNPKFFWMLMRENGYEYIKMQLVANNCSRSYEYPENSHLEIVPEVLPDGRYNIPLLVDMMVRVSCRKTDGASFVFPLDIPTGAHVTNPGMRRRYWRLFGEPVPDTVEVSTIAPQGGVTMLGDIPEGYVQILQTQTVSGVDAPDKDVCVMFLSCIGDLFRYFMHYSDDFLQKYEFRAFIFNSLETFASLRGSIDTYLNRAKVLIYHPADVLGFGGGLLDDYADWVDNIPSHIIKVGVSQPHLHFLWPFHCNDPRNEDEKRHPNQFGSKPFVYYGDAFIINLLQEGVDKEEIIRRYLAVDLMAEANKMHAFTTKFLERQDRCCTIKIADYILSNYKSIALFRSINHPNNRLAFEISNRILSAIDCRTVSSIVLDQTQELQALEMPIHPYLINHFGIAFANQNTRYAYDFKRLLTFEEYVRDTVYFDIGAINSDCLQNG